MFHWVFHSNKGLRTISFAVLYTRTFLRCRLDRAHHLQGILNSLAFCFCIIRFKREEKREADEGKSAYSSYKISEDENSFNGILNVF